jgi:hypothetical protein
MSTASRINARAARLGLGKLEAGRGGATCAYDAALVTNAKPAPIPTNLRLVILDIRVSWLVTLSGATTAFEERPSPHRGLELYFSDRT